MPESSIPVDLLNPGQVFASLGLLEAADILLGRAEAAFDWTDGRETVFRLTAAGEDPPVEHVLRFLNEAKAIAKVPGKSRNLEDWKKSWGEKPEVLKDKEPFPFPDPDSPATLPVVLRDESGRELALEYWGDATRRDNVKFWAGSGGKPGAAVLRDSLELVRGKISQHANNPYALSAAQTSSFRLDWRRDYVPVQDGFSPNRHKQTMTMVGYPLVEILAAIGVTNARPVRESKLEYRYGVLGFDGCMLPPMFHRLALGTDVKPIPGHPWRRFVMHLDWPGQEDQARCITQVSEVEYME